MALRAAEQDLNLGRKALKGSTGAAGGTGMWPRD